MKNLNEELNKHGILIFSIIVSFDLLLVFLIFQNYDLNFLNLDIKWLIVCGLPILIALFAGGYIKSFKGFGIEVEAIIKDSGISQIDTTFDFGESPEINKESLDRLNRLNPLEKESITRLRFFLGKRHDYESHTIQKYHNLLPNLRYFEIANKDKEFLFLFPIPKSSVIINTNQWLEKLIKAIVEEDFIEVMPHAVTDVILTTDNLIEAYRKFTFSSQTRFMDAFTETLPVLNEKHVMDGIIEKQKLEEKISKKVLKTIDHK